MQKLLMKMKDDLFAAGITNKELAVRLGINEKKVSYYLNGNTQFSFQCFSDTLILLYKHNPELRRACLFEYCEKIKGNKNLKIGMEFVHARGEFNLLETLIKKAELSKDDVTKEWAEVYRILYRRSKEHLVGKLLLTEVEKKRKTIKSTEMSLVLDIIYCYGLYDMSDYRFLYRYACDVKEKIEKEIPQKEKFLKQSFTIKINESIHAACLSLCKIKETREYTPYLMKYLGEPGKYPIPQASALNVLGESYIFEDYNKAKAYLEQALYVLGDAFNDTMKNKKRCIMNTLNFLKIYHGKDLDDLHLTDPAEIAYLEIKRGNNEKAIEILNGIEIQNGKLSAFQLCYMGIAKGDKKLIEKSLKKFEENGNLFYAQLPKLYLGIL
ncbi:transcriptional regulator [Bacillus thuringiensis]|uniref:AimR family lysis-lysogeny pheromone receptor n=1 Tax=Bacillus thuringiensis TaxID=1428 RepID=UPI000BECA4EF|nr:AimR family lysis-lysogeny pheromone receptor [Bacillus thuringiensis]PED27271.1 transcriptional regulator [Bacillus thuringiensis]